MARMGLWWGGVALVLGTGCGGTLPETEDEAESAFVEVTKEGLSGEFGVTNVNEDFDPTENLSETAALSNQVQVEVSGNDVYVVWVDRATGDGDVYFRVSHDEGRTFEEPINLSMSTRTAFAPQLARSGSSVYVTWQEDGVRFAASHDQGENFEPSERISGVTGGRPQIAAVDEHVYVTWPEGVTDVDDSEEGFIQFRASHNRGDSFDDLITLNTNRAFGAVDIAAAGDSVYVIWDEFITRDLPEVRFRRSTNNGDSFGGVRNMSEFSSAVDRSPQLAAVGDNVYAVWSRCITGSPCEIIFRRSTNDGSTFSSRRNLSSNSGDSVRPIIDATGDNVYVVWTDTTPGSQEVFFRRSTSEGESFSSTRNLSNTPGNSVAPALASVGSFVRVIWHDDTFGNDEILYRVSDDRGGSFEGIDNLSETPGTSNFGDIIATSTEVHVVWLDNTPGNADIFYRRGEVAD